MKTRFMTAMAVLFSWAAWAQETLYHINFQTPDQAVNQVVKTGPGPDHVSSVVFGSPVVVPAFGALTSQPLLFNSNGQQPLGTGYYYTQIGLSLAGHPTRTLDLSFDFFDTGPGHFFTVLFDTPNVRNFQFDAGQIAFDNPVFPAVNVGNYQLGRAYHFAIHIDDNLNRWSFFADNNFLAQGVFDPSDYVSSIRFNYAAAGPDISGTGIDNIVVVVPEPASAGLLILAGLGMFMARRR